MDIQKTMEFILRQQAKAEAEMAAMRQRSVEAEAKAEGHMTAIWKLVNRAQRLTVENDKLIASLRHR